MERIPQAPVKAVRIEVLNRGGETLHKVICPHCRKVMIYPLRSHLYPKGSTMRCSGCKRIFKKFERTLRE